MCIAVISGIKLPCSMGLRDRHYFNSIEAKCRTEDDIIILSEFLSKIGHPDAAAFGKSSDLVRMNEIEYVPGIR